MELEIQLFHKVKKYLISLGYPSDGIFFDYIIDSRRHVDVVVKINEKVLIVIEVKSENKLHLNKNSEIGFNPIARKLQKEAQSLGAKVYILSNGENHLWLQTGESGRPEITIEIAFKNFNYNTLSESKFTKEILQHIVEFLKNFPITGINVYDTSIVFYAKLFKELNGNTLDINELYRILDRDLIAFNVLDIDKSIEYLKEALYRLEAVNFIKNKIAVIEFIDELSNHHEINIPRWLADLTIKVLDLEPHNKVLDLFTRNGIFTSAAYLNDIKNTTSIYTDKKSFYWIKFQQLLLNGIESEIDFRPMLLNGNVDVLQQYIYDALILAPPFNLNINSWNYDNPLFDSIKDSNSLFLLAAIDATKSEGKILAIVPDSLLTSSKFIKTRELLLHFCHIESIINLPVETFKPYIIKTSIITLLKKGSISRNKTFLASIDEVPKGNPLQIKYSKELEEIYNRFCIYKKSEDLNTSKTGFIIEKIDVNNFYFSKNWLEINNGNSKNLQQGYISVPLKELLININRGSSIVEDKAFGEIPFISPSSIRSMRLLMSQLTYTSTEKAPNNLKKVKLNDIVINAIGPYRGNAALVTEEFVGLPINRHVITVSVNKNLVLPGYLTIALNSQFVKEQFFDNSTGSVIPALNLSSFDDIYIPVPSLEEQENIYNNYYSILAELNYINEKALALEANLNEKLNQLGKEGGNI